MTIDRPLARHRINLSYRVHPAVALPRTMRSMHIALRELGLEHLWVVYPGDEEYALDARITALPIGGVARLRERLAGSPPAPSSL